MRGDGVAVSVGCGREPRRSKRLVGGGRTGAREKRKRPTPRAVALGVGRQPRCLPYSLRLMRLPERDPLRNNSLLGECRKWLTELKLPIPSPSRWCAGWNGYEHA